MALVEDALDAAALAISNLITHISTHTADPGGTGANESAGGGYARQAVTWTGSTGGVRSANATLAFTGTALSGATHVGGWSASTAGTFYGGAALTGDQAYNAAGEYNVTALTITVSAA